jgi:hypothetical protein
MPSPVVLIPVGAAIAAAYAWSKQHQPADAIVRLDQTTIDLFIAMAQGIENINQTLGSGESGEPGAVTMQGYPKNVDDIEINRIQIGALNTAYQLPDIQVPNGFNLVIKAWGNNAGIIYIGKSAPDVLNINQVFPLWPNDFIGEAVTNAKMFYISGTAVTDSVSLFVGHRKGGG